MNAGNKPADLQTPRPLIEVRALHKTYPGGPPVLRGIDLQVATDDGARGQRGGGLSAVGGQQRVGARDGGEVGAD